MNDTLRHVETSTAGDVRRQIQAGIGPSSINRATTDLAAGRRLVAGHKERGGATAILSSRRLLTTQKLARPAKHPQMASTNDTV